GIVLLNLGSSL
ncbi:hypothetical protein MKD33_02735, partial [Chromobacterium piscinae]